MRILSFDIGKQEVYVCLSNGTNILAEQILICDAQDRQFAGSSIMSTVIDVLHKAGWHRQDLQAIVVGTGPGSFTGIRVAVVTARTLCQALNLPLLGINRFECYAFKEQLEEFPVAMILTAGKKQYFCARITNATGNTSWQMDTYPLSEDQLSTQLQDFEHIYIEKSDAIHPYQVLPELTNPAVTQTHLAIKRLQSFSEKAADPTFLLTQFPYQQVKPLYVHSPSVTVKSLSAPVN